jgi:lipopolysaccharide assembly outer membrane protein LptD (OstA)
VASRVRSFVPRCCGHVRAGAAILAALVAFAAHSVLAPDPVAAQASTAQVNTSLLHFPARPPLPKRPATQSDAPMLLQATEIRYDYTNNTVSAVGNVQIYYNGSTVEADEVVYDQKTKRLQARGNVRMPSPKARSPTANSSISPTITATALWIHCVSKPSTIRGSPPRAPIA